MRAEFEKASRLRLWLLAVQFGVAIPAALAVVIPDTQNDLLYWIAIAGAVLLAIWWFLNGHYLRVRGAGFAALRGALLLGGLDNPLSPHEVNALRERFTVTAAQARANEKSDYYATKLLPGPARLGEMLEESAFYSEPLQRLSSQIMLGLLLLFAIIFLVIAIAIMPQLGRDAAHTARRVFLAFLAFAMSADVIGAYRAHRAAASEIRDIRQRLIASDAAHYPIADVMLAFSDYLSAIEAAPESVPHAYKVRTQDLNERWADYRRDRDERRAAQGRQ